MKKVLVTGAFGNVGRSTLAACLERGYQVAAFDTPTPANHRVARTFGRSITVRWGDIRNVADVGEAVGGIDAVIHLAAVIPPLADRKPVFARYVNVGGTENLVRAMERCSPRPELVYASSIAVYGDRLANPEIRVTDPVSPNPDDPYSQHKASCEELIAASALPWTVLRLTYIVSTRKLDFDPLMFRMPLATRIETCDTADAGCAFAAALETPGIRGRILDIGGGERCRTTYRDYVARMLSLFGLGAWFPPEDAFARKGFHCGWLADSDESEGLLHYRKSTLADHYAAVGERSRSRRFWLTMVRQLARAYVLSRSSYLAEALRATGKTVWQFVLRRRNAVAG